MASAAPAGPQPTVAFSGTSEVRSRYQPQVSCDPTEKPGTVALRDLLRGTYGKANGGGIVRSCAQGGTSEHKEGRAYDWMLNASDPADKALADSFLAWLVGPDAAGVPGGNAHRLGIQYVIWDRQTWQSWTGAWKPYDGASPHTDHVHVSLSWDGALRRTSWWTGATVTRADHGPCQVYVGELVPAYSGPNYTSCPRAVPRPVGDPVGRLDEARPALGAVALRGWAKDPDTADPLAVHVYVDGHGQGAFVADRPRPDLGGAHGFEITLPVGHGNHRVCVYAINVGRGASNPSLGCAVLARAAGDPVGNHERVVPAPGGLRTTGWAIDPDSTSPVATHVYVDGRYAGQSTASKRRPDVGRAFPLMGSDHGLETVVPAAGGSRDVCVYAINVGPGGSNPLVGCREVAALGNHPIGSLDSVTGGNGSARVTGWTLDPDVAGSIPVHVYVDGRYRGSAVASGPRPDVRAAFPGWDAQRGFTTTVGGLSRGRHDVCVYAIGAGPGGTNPLLRCQPVTVG